MSGAWVLVGNPSCRRVAFWQAALQRQGLPPAQLASYVELLTETRCLDEYLLPGTVLRLESAAEDWQTYKLLLQHGIEPARHEGYAILEREQIDSLERERGWLLKPRQAHLGFVRLLNTLCRSLTSADVRLLNHPDEICVQFDKPRCQQFLDDAQIPIPHRFGTVCNYAELRDRHHAGGRVMLKLANGSGGAGCMALHWSRGRVRALATVREQTIQGERRLYVCKHSEPLQHEPAIACLVNRLCAEKVHVEEWLPKARWQGRNFDLRIVTIGGEPRHTVARVGRSTFTNLNLGNQRGDLAAIRNRLGPHEAEIHATIRRAARLFPRSFTLGFDVLVSPDLRRHVVLEVNAFGNLLPRLLDRDEDTYTAAVAAWQGLKRRENCLVPS